MSDAISLPTPYAAGRIAAFLAEHLSWTAFWDKQITLGRFQLGTVEVARQHDESIAPPCGCGIWQVHRGILRHRPALPRSL